MFPDQNQEQPQAIPAQPVSSQQPSVPAASPTQPVPGMSPVAGPVLSGVPDPAVSPVGMPPTSVPFAPIPDTAPVGSPLGTPASSAPSAVPEVAQPQAANPLIPGSEPAAPTPQPPVPPTLTPTPPPVSAPAGPIVQPPADLSQPSPMSPTGPAQPMAPMAGSVGRKGNVFTKLRVIIAIVVGLSVLGGAAFFAKSALLSGGVSVKDLVQDEANGVSFKRPKTWSKSDKDSTSSQTIFTEKGISASDANQYVAIMSEKIPYDYDSLSAPKKQQVSDMLKDSLTSDGSGGTSDESVCQERGDRGLKQVTMTGYSIAFLVDETCNKFKFDNGVVGKVKYKAVMGVVGKSVQGITIVAADSEWKSSGQAFDEIINTIKPAN